MPLLVPPGFGEVPCFKLKILAFAGMVSVIAEASDVMDLTVDRQRLIKAKAEDFINYTRNNTKSCEFW